MECEQDPNDPLCRRNFLMKEGKLDFYIEYDGDNKLLFLVQDPWNLKMDP